MKKNRTGSRKPLSVFLALWLCLALVPLTAFAESLPDAELRDADDPSEAVQMAEEENQDIVPEEEPYVEAEEDVLAEDPVTEDTEQAGEAETAAEPEYAEEAEEPAAEDWETEDMEQSDSPAYAAPANTQCDHIFVKYKKYPATCQHTGLQAYSECSKCGAIYDYAGTKPIEKKSLVIPLVQHKWDSGTVVRKATPQKNGILRKKCTVCGTTEDVQTAYKPSKVAKSIKLDGNNLKFKYNVVTSSPAFMKKARIDQIWLKAGKKKITVNWQNAKNMKLVDGVIILRKTGKSKTYSEVKRFKFSGSNAGISSWFLKSKFTDKTAKKKNTPYTYVVVTFKKYNGYVYISHCSDWASAQTIGSRLKSVNTAKINKKSAYLQFRSKVSLSCKYANPKKTYMSSSIRWSSDNKKVAKVSSKGVVIGAGEGSTIIRGRLASGNDIECRVDVVGAFKPGTPSLKVDIADNNSITLVWTSVPYATGYNLYRSDDGLHWNKPIKVSGTTKKVTGLTKGHRYTFYVVARNDNYNYTSLGENSNVIYQKAVIVRRPTTVTGFPRSLTLKTGNSYTASLKITTPAGRVASLQMLSGSTWVTKKTVALPQGIGTSQVSITFPSDWWGGKTEWRLVIPRTNTAEGYTSDTLKITATRRYQNPGAYVQIKDSIGTHGYGYYVSPVLVNGNSTRADHVEALIKTASKYLGNSYINGRSGQPGYGVDASGLIIQSCYGAGVDLWPISPSTRPANCVPRIMSSALQKITYTEGTSSGDHPGVLRGDLIFFYTSDKVVGHVAIYLGWDRIIHASMLNGRVEKARISTLTKPLDDGGKYGYKVAGVRRVFY